MQATTLLIAIIASVIILFTRPIWSLVVYFLVMAWYPSYLTVKVGTIDFTACRIVILAIYLSLFLRRGSISRFRFIWLDKLLIIYFLCQLAAGVVTTPIAELLENRAGAVFDTVLPYFAVRMIITRKEQYLTLLKGILVIAAPLAAIGLCESLTGYNPMVFLKQYCPWRGGNLALPNPRSGFYRAFFSFPHPITFGLFFAMLGPICAGLLSGARRHMLIYLIGICLMVLGVFSCMSSGPFIAAFFAVIFMAFFPFRKYWKMACVTLILMCIVVEVISNRHFYEVVDRVALNSATAWYRTRLIEVALFEGGMAGYWLTGFGFRDPGWWEWASVDIVNHYIRILCSFGLIGLMPFLALIAAAVKKVIEAYKVSVLESDRWLVWCLAAGLFGTLTAMNGVSLGDQPRTIFYMMLGFCGTMPVLMRHERIELLRLQAQ